MLAKIPFLLKFLLPNRLWNLPREEKAIYLTFDDGPIPEVTPWVLEQLRHYNAKATFFCIGDNVRKHPEVLQQILAEGHKLGNHTFNHLNGWRTSSNRYLQNVLQAQAELERYGNAGNPGRLFRPPYGKIREKQVRLLKEQNFRVVMWEVLSKDYDQRLSPEKCLQNVIRNAGPGSIIVFHDSLKAERNLKATLPRVLEHYSRQGLEFRALI